MKATQLLANQHRKVEALFKKLEGGRSDPATVLTELANNLAAHMAIEQDIFYPAVKSIDDEIVNESFEEHALAEVALKRLLLTNPDDEAFEARCSALKELVLHHVKEEESELFPKVEKQLDDARLNELGKAMKTAFDQANKAGYEATVPKGMSRTSADVSKKKLAKRTRAA